MNYKEITINLPADQIDSCCADLTDLGINGFVIESEEDFRNFLQQNQRYWDYVDEELEQQYRDISRIKFWIGEEDNPLFLEVMKRYPSLSARDVSDSDWENNWREFYKPLEIGTRTVVVPEWEHIPDNGRIPLILDPGLIFGTGSHATTQMCLTLLEEYAGPGKRVLDLGCGSGILGIGALNLGCESCVGIDIDPKAPDIVLANTALNKSAVGKMTALAGDVLSDRSIGSRIGTGYDIVLANIVADVIIALSSKVRAFMKPDAVFICSGIIDGREKEVLSALEQNGFVVIQALHQEEWNAFCCKMKEDL